MKLCAIYCVWGDYDLLYHSTENIRPLVDGVIIVASEKSNYGELHEIPFWGRDFLVNREPQFYHPMNSETDKRNYGLKIAREQGYTHFIMMDADEFYECEDVSREKQKFIDRPDLQGLVCRTRVYFKSPRLTIGFDTTLVPFMHKITPSLKHEFNRRYPFAWEGHNIRIDPTRSLNINSGVEMCDTVMHHYSWVRKDYEKKIRNSTARQNIEKSTIREDLVLAKDGYKVKFYDKVLYTVENKFNLPEYDVMV
ncbi:MAG TPA: hypothetical protein VFU05_09200 [Cyclobacteriaceae bacterium]|nr:hypothetical protein [Cyclobacteriaceae bacterium]